MIWQYCKPYKRREQAQSVEMKAMWGRRVIRITSGELYFPSRGTSKRDAAHVRPHQVTTIVWQLKAGNDRWVNDCRLTYL